MTTYARNVNNQAIDVVTADPTTLFHADVAAQFIVVPDGTETGAKLTNGIWTNPAPYVAPVVPVVHPTVDIPTFMNLFTLQEQLAIEGSTDPMVVTMWKRFSDPRVQSVNLNLGSIQGALEYLSVTMQEPALTPTNATYIQPTRIAQINTGTPQ